MRDEERGSPMKEFVQSVIHLRCLLSIHEAPNTEKARKFSVNVL